MKLAFQLRSAEDSLSPSFMEDTAQLGIKPATQNPRVINYMDEIIAFVSTLVDKVHYVSEGDVADNKVEQLLN